jgi:hypothetical protein
MPPGCTTPLRAADRAPLCIVDTRTPGSRASSDSRIPVRPRYRAVSAQLCPGGGSNLTHPAILRHQRKGRAGTDVARSAWRPTSIPLATSRRRRAADQRPQRRRVVELFAGVRGVPDRSSGRLASRMGQPVGPSTATQHAASTTTMSPDSRPASTSARTSTVMDEAEAGRRGSGRGWQPGGSISRLFQIGKT